MMPRTTRGNVAAAAATTAGLNHKNVKIPVFAANTTTNTRTQQNGKRKLGSEVTVEEEKAAAKGRTRTLPPRKTLTRRADISVAVPRRAGLVEKTNSQANIISEKGKTGKPLKELKQVKEASKKVVPKKAVSTVIPAKKISVATATKSITTEVIVSGDDIIAVTKKKEATSVKVSAPNDESAASDKENEDPDSKKQNTLESDTVSDKDVELTKKATLEAAKENLTSTKDVNVTKEKANIKDKKPVRKVLGENTTILNAGTTQTEKETRTAVPVKTAKKTPLAEATPFVEQSEKKDFTIAEKIEPTSKRVKMEFIDLDSEDIGDPVMVYEYVDEIVGYWRKLEVQSIPSPDYMTIQKDLDWNMRSTLVDWIVEVHSKLSLLPETLFLAVNIIDRFLAKKPVSVGKLQLVGIAGLLIACKYEEIYCPSVKQFVFLADETYKADEILRAERYVLGVLDFNLSFPSPLNFLRRCSKADDYDLQTRTMAKYLLESIMLSENFIAVTSSIASAAAMYISRQCLHGKPWTATVAHYSQYDLEDMKDTVVLMMDHLLETREQVSIYQKYDRENVFHVSKLLQEWAVKRHQHADYGFAFETVADPEVESDEE